MTERRQLIMKEQNGFLNAYLRAPGTDYGELIGSIRSVVRQNGHCRALFFITMREAASIIGAEDERSEE